jgi:hypothetical protein
MMSHRYVTANIVLTVECGRTTNEAVAKAWAELVNIEEQACNDCAQRFENVIHTFIQEHNILTAEEVLRQPSVDDLALQQQLEMVPYAVYIETYRQQDDDGIMYTLLLNVDQLVLLISALKAWKAVCKEAAEEVNGK